MADKIMVIRHAEKPDEPPPPFGVDPSGNQDAEDLALAGWQRAGALACLFAPWTASSRSPELATPRTIYASAVAHHSHSLRPQHTVAPLATVLGLIVDTSFAEGDEPALAEAAKRAAGPVLIAWHHERIPDLGNAIVGDHTSCPQTWPGKRFDLVWVFNKEAETWSFTQIPQALLAGDRATPIG